VWWCPRKAEWFNSATFCLKNAWVGNRLCFAPSRQSSWHSKWHSDFYYAKAPSEIDCSIWGKNVNIFSFRWVVLLLFLWKASGKLCQTDSKHAPSLQFSQWDYLFLRFSISPVRACVAWHHFKYSVVFVWLKAPSRLKQTFIIFNGIHLWVSPITI
jgi:hypothetical protein